MANRYADRNLRQGSIQDFLDYNARTKAERAAQEKATWNYYNQNGAIDPNATLSAEAAGIIPGTGGLGSTLSKYFGNLFGTTARKTGERVAANSKNIAKGFKDRVDNVAKLNKAKDGAKTIPNTIKQSAAKTRVEASKAAEKKLLSKVTKQNKANKLAKTARDSTRNKTAISAAAGTGITGLTAAMMDAGTRKQGPGTQGPSGTGNPAVDQAIVEEALNGYIDPYDYSGSEIPIDNTSKVNGESYYGDKIPLGDPNGRLIPGYAGARLNEVSSSVRPTPSPGNIVNTVRNAQSKNGKGYTAKEASAAEYKAAQDREWKMDRLAEQDNLVDSGAALQKLIALSQHQKNLNKLIPQEARGDLGDDY